jgi:hypothetical protein
MAANVETIRKKGKLRSISTKIGAVEEQHCTWVNTARDDLYNNPAMRDHFNASKSARFIHRENLRFSRRPFPSMTGIGPNMANCGQCCALNLSLRFLDDLIFIELKPFLGMACI